MSFLKNKEEIQLLIKEGEERPLATQNYPSRGQTAVQKLYQTKRGKLFLKKVSDRNHQECQIDVLSGTLAEREFWAFKLAHILGLRVPEMILLDSITTVQTWLEIPDAHHFITDQGPLDLNPLNVFECACFDWLTGQIDRHDANYLYDYVKKEIVLIDSAHAFLKYDGSLPHYLQIFESGFRSSLDLKQKSLVLEKIISIQKLLPKHVPLRNEDEKNTLSRRAAQLSDVQSVKDIINLYRKSL